MTNTVTRTKNNQTYEIFNTFFNKPQGEFTTKESLIKYFNSQVYPKSLMENIKNETYPKTNFTIDQLESGVEHWKLTIKKHN